MAGPPTAGVAELRYQFGGVALPLGAQTSIGVFWINDVETTLDVAQAAWENNLRVITPQSMTLQQIVLKRGPVATGPTYSRPVNVGGQAGFSTVPPNTTFLARKTVEGISGRYGGRMFYPGPEEANVDSDGTILASVFEDYRDAFSGFFDDLVLGSLSPQVFSSVSSDTRPIAALTLETRVATQRRRLRR